MNTACSAKINLRLRVFGRDDTGFHSVETILVRTDLADDLTIEEAEAEAGIRISVAGPAAEGVPVDGHNLCALSARRFLDAAFARRKRPGLHIRLEKRIPVGSGLGGGSSDAAGTLRLLAERWPRLSPLEVLGIAGEIGSDVAFGLLDAPMALGWERGRRLLPLRPPPERPGLVVSPPFSVSTPDAYGWLNAGREDNDPGGGSIFPGPTRLATWDSLGRLVRNDLQGPVFERHAKLANALAIMQDSAAVASMTGSGSSLFGVFESEEAREDALESLSGSGMDEAAGWRRHEVRLPV